MLDINKKIILILFIFVLSIKISLADTCPSYADTAPEFRSTTTQIILSFLGGKTTLTSQEVSILYDF